jgi:uncharacterized protein (TIGR02453 family)
MMTTQFEFNGFPPQALQFLQELKANNRREWFEAHRTTYQDQLLKPAQEFVLALGTRLQHTFPGVRFDPATNGSGTLMRIYRDTRFSADKTPYKSNISGMFWEGQGKKTEVPAFGFQLDPNGMRLMAGMFHFPKPMLLAYRQAVADEELGPALLAALAQIRQAGNYALIGEQYQRVPAEYDPEHPRRDLLRYKYLYVSMEDIPPQVATSLELVDTCFRHFRNMAPLQQWLVRAADKAGL